MITLPNAPTWVAGLGVYHSETIIIVNTPELLGFKKAAGSRLDQQVIVLKKRGEHDGINVFGLLVDELGGIPTLSKDAFMEATKIFNTSRNFVDTLAKTDHGILAVISVEQICEILDGIKIELAPEPAHA